MDEYREEVERLAKARTGEPIFNSTSDHAAIIIEKIFAYARAEVCIVSSHLNERVFGRGPVVDQAAAFLAKPGSKVRILLEDDIDSISPSHPMLQLFACNAASVDLAQMPGSVKEAVKYHYTLGDDDTYRFESDKTKWEAVAAFGDRTGAANLKKVFDLIWGGSKKVSLGSAVTAEA